LKGSHGWKRLEKEEAQGRFWLNALCPFSDPWPIRAVFDGAKPQSAAFWQAELVHPED